MSLDILLIAVLCALSLIGYMIAINAHGPIRLGLSYFLATILLAGTVWVIIQHVNTGYDAVEMAKINKIEMEKKQVEAKVETQEEALKVNKERMAFAVKLNGIIASGLAYSMSLASFDLVDRSAELETLVARSNGFLLKANTLKKQFDSLSTTDRYFDQVRAVTRDGVQLLIEAAQYCRQYYYAEDTDQETLRERIMRQKAQNAQDKFRNAGTLIASQG